MKVTKRRSNTSKYRGVTFRSKYEADVAKELDELGVQWEYEPDSFEYVLPPATYTPDFKITRQDGSVQYIEVKGFLDVASRIKHALIKKQHPDLNIDFHFMKNNKITPRSKVTYKDWATKNGYKFTVGHPELCCYRERLTKD